MKRLPKNAYGMLLAFDGYGADLKRCADTGPLYRFLYDLPGTIGMRRLGFPHIVRVDEAGIKGLSGFTFIMESHVSIHTYEERGFVTADVYSCKPFDAVQVSALLSAYFRTSTHASSVIVRGKKFNIAHPRQRKRPRNA